MKWKRGYDIQGCKIHGGALEIKAGGLGTVLFHLSYPNPCVNDDAVQLVKKGNKIIAYASRFSTIWKNFNGVDSACRIDVKDIKTRKTINLYEKS